MGEQAKGDAAAGTGHIATPDEQVHKLLWPKIEGGLYSETQEAIRVLAEILGAPRVEPVPTGTGDWISRLLGLDEATLSTVKRELPGTMALLYGHVLAGWIAEHGDAVKVIGPFGKPPEYRPLSLAEDHTVSVPAHICVFFPAGTLRDEPVGFYHDARPMADITVYTQAGQRELAESVLDDMDAALRGERNPFRGQVLRVLSKGGHIAFEPTKPTGESREDLILSQEIWDEVDLFLATTTTRREDLVALGLSTSRGLLLAGKPGVGKTKLGRVLASELVGQLTVMLVEPDVLAGVPERLYDEVERLGPTLVILEDIDTVAAAERRGSSGFAEFLSALDGARVRNDILTLATTNDPGSLDPAVKRPGRFDVIVEVPVPGPQAREAILGLYLPGHGQGVDLRAVADSLDGATGAEIREVARRAVLEHGGDNVSTEKLLDITRTGRWKPAPAVGHYL